MGDGWAWAGHLYPDEPTTEREWLGMGETIGPDANLDLRIDCGPARTDYGFKDSDPNASKFDPTQPEVRVSNCTDGTVILESLNIPNEQARRIVHDILPPILELYLCKSKDYGGNVMQQLKLGPKACFPDLWRKIGKVKLALWDDQPLAGEQLEEVLADAVGHLLIILDELREAKLEEHRKPHVHTRTDILNEASD